jgi:flagellar FliJ protein
VKKSQRIKVIVDIKAAQEKNALEVLGATQRKLLTLQVQVEGLRNYRKEYQDRFEQLGVKGVLRNFWSFGRLSTSLKRQ